MMNNITINDFDKFSEIITSLEASYNKLKEISNKEKDNKEKINSTETWTGYSQKAMYDKYNILTNDFDQIEYSLDVYIKFLRKTLEDYRLIEEEINKNANLVSNELDVNSEDGALWLLI